jgi:hypothetical protein
MIMVHLQGVSNAVLRLAQRQGYVVPRDVRRALAVAGVSGDFWREVIGLAHDALSYRQGRYYYQGAPGLRPEQDRQQRDIQRVIREITRRHKAVNASSERRRQSRIDFIQPVKVVTEDQRTLTLLSRDISTLGLCLIGTRSLLGQKVRVDLPLGELGYLGGLDDLGTNGETASFWVRILWTCAIGDDLFENGGSFLEMITPALKPASGARVKPSSHG